MLIDCEEDRPQKEEMDMQKARIGLVVLALLLGGLTVIFAITTVAARSTAQRLEQSVTELEDRVDRLDGDIGNLRRDASDDLLRVSGDLRRDLWFLRTRIVNGLRSDVHRCMFFNSLDPTTYRTSHGNVLGYPVQYSSDCTYSGGAGSADPGPTISTGGIPARRESSSS